MGSGGFVLPEFRNLDGGCGACAWEYDESTTMRWFAKRGASLLSLALIAAACSNPTARPSPSGSTPSLTTSGPSAESQPLISSLPSGCDATDPVAKATLAFVAQGRAWAAAPDGTELTCLFDVTDPGPFLWGPRADRVLIGGLEVRGVGSMASRPPSSLQPTSVSWARPTGLAVAFVDPNGKELEKALVGSSKIENVTPHEEEGHFPTLTDVTFQEVVYHPSGLAIGFVLTHRIEGSSIYVSSNTGGDPHRLVWSRSGTVFGPIAFGLDGKTIYYVAHLANDTRLITAADLGTGRLNPGLWMAKENVLELVPAPSGEAVAIDIGTGCDDRVALLSKLDKTGGSPLLPGASAPTSVIGWVDDSTALVSEGDCNGPARLWEVQANAGGTATLVIDGVDRAATRVPDPTPAPPLPKIPVDEEFA
jgi:hypothetical protein